MSLTISTRDLVSTVLPANVWASTTMVLGGCFDERWQIGVAFLRGGPPLAVAVCQGGLGVEQEGFAVGADVGKVGYIGSRTGVVDAGVSKWCFFVV